MLGSLPLEWERPSRTPFVPRPSTVQATNPVQKTAFVSFPESTGIRGTIPVCRLVDGHDSLIPTQFQSSYADNIIPIGSFVSVGRRVIENDRFRCSMESLSHRQPC